MLNSPTELSPFYLFSGITYLGLVWFLIDIVRVKTGRAYSHRSQNRRAIHSQTLHDDAQAAAKRGDFETAYRLEETSRAIELERAEKDEWGISVAKSYPRGMIPPGDYIMHFWWRVFGTLTVFSFVYLGLMIVNGVGYVAAPLTRKILPLLSAVL